MDNSGVVNLGEFASLLVEGHDNVFERNSCGQSGAVFGATTNTSVVVQGGLFVGNVAEEVGMVVVVVVGVGSGGGSDGSGYVLGRWFAIFFLWPLCVFSFLGRRGGGGGCLFVSWCVCRVDIGLVGVPSVRS